MHGNLEILLKRVDRALDEKIRPAISYPLAELSVSTWEVEGDPVDFATAMERIRSAGQLPRLSLGEPWGAPWETTWMRLEVDQNAQLTPPDFAPRDEYSLEAQLDLGWQDHSVGFQAEGLVRREDGSIIKAVNPKNQWIPAAQLLVGESLWVEAAANPLLLDVHPFLPTAEGDILTSSKEPIYRLKKAHLVARHEPTRVLALQLEALYGLARNQGDSARGWEIALTLGRALDQFPNLEIATIHAHAAAASEQLSDLFATKSKTLTARMSVVGHAHIDSAWLWPIRETRRKVKRTLANVCRLIEDGAEMVFALPAAQHLAWIEADEPELFERIRSLIAAGKITPVGSMWVEPDAVLPGGEGLARQLCEGIAYFAEKFDQACAEIWLPDSFGYSAAIPQLALQAGVGNFLTQKISWNQHNTFPHHTLWWEGLDGSRVFTHFPPIDTYGAQITAAELKHAETNFKDRGRTNLSLIPYGYGDGGGGPTREMLERIEVFNSLPDAPQLVHESSADFFAAARAAYPDAPVWAGELYLEYHRGTFTSQARTKEGIRRCEYLLRAAEALATQAHLVKGSPYPGEKLQKLWQDLLLTHFHDIMPGSSIAWVYREVEAMLAEIASQAELISADAARALAGEGDRQISFNTAPVTLEQTAPYGACEISEESPKSASVSVDGAFTVLETGSMRLTIDESGQIHSYLANGREVVPPQQIFGQLFLAQDFPNMWDAWDIDYFYRGSLTPVTQTRLLASGVEGQCAFAEVGAEFGNSSAQLTWRLTPEHLEVAVSVDWREDERLLKLALPVDVHTDHARFETQFGHVTRATHENTSWDFFRFEVPCHRWLHLGEPDWGVGIANSRTYGWDVTRHGRAGGSTFELVRATLLRSAKYPDPQADRGEHTFNFRITPGASLSDTISSGYALNTHTLRVSGNCVPAPLLQLSGGICESVRLAPDDSGDVLLRIYEPHGCRSRARLELPWAAAIKQTDLLGRSGTPLPQCPDQTIGDAGSEGTVYEFELRPFQVVTLRARVEK